MKRIAASIILASLLSLSGVAALAQEKNLKEHFTFENDVRINSTVVKKGRYLVEYDAQKGEMSILDGDKLVARAKATVKLNDKKFRDDALLTTTTPEGAKVIGMRLGGQREELTIGEDVAGSN
jgi:hypothetical protein